VQKGKEHTNNLQPYYPAGCQGKQLRGTGNMTVLPHSQLANEPMANQSCFPFSLFSLPREEQQLFSNSSPTVAAALQVLRMLFSAIHQQM